MGEEIIIVYETPWVINRIHSVSDRIRGRVVDQTLFEDRCIKRVGGYLIGDTSRTENRRYVDRLINEVAAEAVRRNKREEAELFSTLIADEEEGEEVPEIEFDPIDVLANVESEIIAKETVALLAEGDLKKEFVLQSWADGVSSVLEISRSLARSYGGNVETHRKSVNRFRTFCRTELSMAI